VINPPPQQFFFFQVTPEKKMMASKSSDPVSFPAHGLGFYGNTSLGMLVIHKSIIRERERKKKQIVCSTVHQLKGTVVNLSTQQLWPLSNSAHSLRAESGV
jgi:hypothetical protein